MINLDRQGLVAHFKGQMNNFLYWSDQLKEILKAKRERHVVWWENAAGFSVSHQDGTKRADTTTRGVMDDEYARDVAWSLILQGLGEVPFAFVMGHQDDPRRMWEFPHQRYSANKTFSKAVLHYSLARTLYADEEMQGYVAMLDQMSAQVVSLDPSFGEGLLVSMLVESFGDRSNLPFGTALSDQPTRDDYTQ